MNPLFDRFLIHNQHWESMERFVNEDPHLKRLNTLPYSHESILIGQIPLLTPGIYLLDGGRQVGKTTLVKQIIKKYLQEKKFKSDHVLFLSGELINAADELRRLFEFFLKDKKGKILIAIDEVNYIPDWDRIIKYFADAIFMDKTSLLLTGSDSVIIRDAIKRFPGRRGKAPQVNYHCYPLSFSEFVNLRNKKQLSLEKLYQEFDVYLQTGGYLTAINEYASSGCISAATLTIYREWIYGDFFHYNKSENYLTEIVKGIIKRYGSQITWNALSKELSIDHHKTVSDYCQLLSQMDAIYILPAILEDKKTAAPKKAKKIYFSDPFIFHSLYSFVEGLADPWGQWIRRVHQSSMVSLLVEGIVVNHFRRFHPTYYIKSDKEIDIAYVQEKKIFPIEVKWTNQLRPDELKHIKKYSSGLVVAKVDGEFDLDGIPVVPLPQYLMELPHLA